MLDKVIFISFDLILLLIGFVIVSAFFINNDVLPEKRMLSSLISIGLSLIIGHTAFDYDLKVLFLYEIMFFALFNFLFIQSNLKMLGHLALSGLLGISVLFLPFESLSFLNNDTFFNTSLVYTVIASIILFVVYRKAIKGNYHAIVKNGFSLMFINALVILLIPIEYALPIVAVLFGIMAWFSITGIIDQNATQIIDLNQRIARLENEFNDELRRAVNKQTFHLKEVQERMSHINKIDNLTKAYNKKAIFDMVEDLIADRRTPEFAMIMFDIDHFKNLNDTLGHIKGDLCLRTLAKIAFDSIRNTDYLGRFGGDEFLILLPKASFNTAMSIAERFRKKIQTETNPKFTVSVGVAHYPQDGNTLKGLLDIADKGLYYSKEKGRNSVSYHNPNLEKKI
ncbi:MAG: diguanylate cyclase [Clostridia bacterium]|nr:diguanylate cyclase [Clostridia bacterium]